MTVGIDLRCLPADGSAGAGVAHAARFLTEAMLACDVPWTWRLYVPVGAQFIAPGPSDRPEGVMNHAPTVQLSDAHGSSLRHTLKSHPCDLLFVPGGSVAPGLSVPSIPWVHDVAIFSHPEWFPQPWWRRMVTTWLFRRGVQHAPVIFSVSQSTKNDLVKLFGIHPDRIIVTLEGGDPNLAEMSEECSNKENASRPFILALGTIEPRKNLAMLIKAWDEARGSFRMATDLVIVGRDGWKHTDVDEAIRNVGTADRGERLIRVTECSDDERRNFLRAASIVVVPSLHEGFGLVALEAMQAGTPVVVSDRGAHPEVVGDGGIILPADDQNAWSAAMARIVNDASEATGWSQKGKQRSSGFSWQASARTAIDGIVNTKNSR